jgi:hypothetical protein
VGARPLPPGPLTGLLEPTLQDHVARTEGDAKPWRVGSQIYVAILGGPIAVTAIALLNARRLRMPGRSIALIAAIGLVATAVAVAIVAVLSEEARILGQVAGAVAAGGFYLLMRSFDRAYFAFAREDEEDAYESLWGPGIAAVLGGSFAMIVLSGLVA